MTHSTHHSLSVFEGYYYISLLIVLLILVHFFEKLYTLLVGGRKTNTLLEENLYLAKEAKMLGIFNKKLVNPPQELNCPAPLNSSKKSKFPDEILQHFISFNPSNAFSMNFGNDAILGYSPSNNHQGMFCGLDNIYCAFMGSLNNLSKLIKQYGLSKGTNEANFIIEAYRTLRDRGPFPANQVIKELDGSFGFVIFDNKAETVFVASDCNGQIELFWGIAADGSVVISENVEFVKASCSKSFAPFPPGCMFHSEHGLTSYEHPMKKMKSMPRVDSEGAMCGANFSVDSQSRKSMIPRNGSEANCATWGSQA